MARERLSVALVTEVFHSSEGLAQLPLRMREARAQGAELAVLPELPLNSWCPSGRVPSDSDAEEEGGARQEALSAAAREAGIWVLGGVILRGVSTGKRHNTALLFDPSGEVIGRYRKLHLPEEEWFWETDHYEPGSALPEKVDVAGFPLGVQICSDVNRPEPTHMLGAMGALAVLAPRATPPASYPRWKVVLSANAVSSTLYVVSVNRPGPEEGALIGGASLVIAPDGEVVAETTDPLVVVTLDRERVEAARRAYPGYLPVRADLYAEGWAKVSAATRGEPRRARSD